MKRLDKQQAVKHAALAAKLSDAREDLNNALLDFNNEVKALFDKMVKPGADAYNAVVAEANEFIGEVHMEQEAYHDEKSEKWQEGDAGSAYNNWMNEWELELDELELDEPEEYIDPDLDEVDDFGQLPQEVPT
jgi:hypothetical protein